VAALEWAVPHEQVTAGLALLDAHRSLYDWDEPRLVHGDFVAQHLLVDSGRITGVIDFQECSGNHPVLDFVNWHASNRYLKFPIPLDALVDAYPDKALFHGPFESLFHLVLLRRSLWMLMVHVEHENPHGITQVRQDLDKALAFLSRDD
jgi:Ser/Thr protein kinase RdoA (MazF antagonist)